MKRKRMREIIEFLRESTAINDSGRDAVSFQNLWQQLDVEPKTVALDALIFLNKRAGFQ